MVAPESCACEAIRVTFGPIRRYLKTLVNRISTHRAKDAFQAPRLRNHVAAVPALTVVTSVLQAALAVAVVTTTLVAQAGALGLGRMSCCHFCLQVRILIREFVQILLDFLPFCIKNSPKCCRTRQTLRHNNSDEALLDLISTLPGNGGFDPTHDRHFVGC